MSDPPEAIVSAAWTEAPVGLGGWDGDCRYVRVNPALAAINGLPAEDHVGRTPAEVMGAFGIGIGEHLRSVLDSGTPVVDLLLERPLPDGGVQTRHSSYYPVRGPDGSVIAVGGVVRDVTAERRAEDERLTALRTAVAARAAAEAAQIRSEAATRVAETARARTQFLADAGRRMAESMDLDATLQEVAELAVPGLADWCAVILLEEGGDLRSVAVAHRDPERTESALAMVRRFPPRPDQERGVAAVVRTRAPELTRDITDEMLVAAAQDDEHLALLREAGFRSSLTVPLLTAGRPLGGLVLVDAESGRDFGPAEVELAEALAALAAPHIRNARLYSERVHVARALQASLLPRTLPAVPGLEVAPRYLPAGDRDDVGGDFYDLFPDGDGAWIAVVGDVSGKGPEAAAVTSLTRHTLRAAIGLGAGPARALEILNSALLADESGRFCTVVVLRLVPADGRVGVTVVNGGHPRPLVVRSDGALEEPEAPGTLVGILRDPAFSATEVELGPGDTILLYTDGVVEARPGGVLAGEAVLHEAASAAAGSSPAELAEAVERAALALHGGRPADDIALLALRCAPH